MEAADVDSKWLLIKGSWAADCFRATFGGLSFFLVFVLFCLVLIFETSSQCVAMTVLELTCRPGCLRQSSYSSDFTGSHLSCQRGEQDRATKREEIEEEEGKGTE